MVNLELEFIEFLSLQYTIKANGSLFPPQVLLAGKPYPLVVLPVNGDYWQEGTNHVCQFDKKGKQVIKPIEPSDLVIEDDVGYCNYKNFFKGQVDVNVLGISNQ